MVLKLDFKKAFDSISWSPLGHVLEAKGFPLQWWRWVQDLNSSSRSVVVLNGVPSKWKGLLHGDHHILVADVLQCVMLVVEAEASNAHSPRRSRAQGCNMQTRR